MRVFGQKKRADSSMAAGREFNRLNILRAFCPMTDRNRFHQLPFWRPVLTLLLGAVSLAATVNAGPSSGSAELANNDRSDLTTLPKMVFIEAGKFSMGREKTWANELPVHQVNVPAFYLSQTEVTFAQYAAFANEQKLEQPYDAAWGRGDRPVINVSWEDAQNYVGWLRVKTGRPFRLPSEAEWEYAAGAGRRTNFSWGNFVLRGGANCVGCGGPWSGKETAPVASFALSAFGLADMHGNVWEWVQDCFHDNYIGAPSDGSAWQNGSCRRVLRGGSWADKPAAMRASKRMAQRPTMAGERIGFRVAYSADAVGK